MRRFIAYLLACITIFLGIGISFKPVVTALNPDLSYRDGKAVTFKLTNKEKSEEPVKEEAATQYAAIMEERLKAFQVTDYRIQTKGNDTLTVTFTADNQNEYDYVAKILSASAKISLSTTSDKVLPVDESHASWHNQKAYLTYDGASSVVVMKIPDNLKVKVKELYDKAKEEEKKVTTTNDDPPKKSIVLWLDRVDGDEYKNKDTDPNVAAKIFYEFTTADFYYGTDENAFKIKYDPKSPAKIDVQAAYREALCAMNILNTNETEYKCSEINREIVPASIENILTYGSTVGIAMSSTIIAVLIAFCVITLLLVLFYRLTAIAIVTTTSIATFITFTLFVYFQSLFNIAALVGLLLVAMTSVFVGIAHNSYFHEEIYKGRNLRKANYEASKKSTLLTIDVSVVMAIVGIMMYFIGGVTVASLGVALIFGAVSNALLNTFVLKGLMWLIANVTSFQTRYRLFGINPKKVPDISKGIKSNYLGPFEHSNYINKRKQSGAIIGALMLASIIGVICFSINQPTMFNTGDYFAKSNELHLTYESPEKTSSLPTDVEIKTHLLDQIKNNNQPLKYKPDVIDYQYTYYVSQTGGKALQIYVTNYVIKLSEPNLNTATFQFKDKTDTFDEVFRFALKSVFPQINLYSVKDVQNYNLTSNAALILLANIVATVVCTLYFWPRYRASRAVAVGLISLNGIVITLGLMTLTRIVAMPIMAISATITTMMAICYGLHFLHRAKELMRDERIRDVTNRRLILRKAYTLALTPASVFAIVTIYLCLNFLAFGNKAFLSLFLGAAFGCFISAAAYATLFLGIANSLDSTFARVKIPELKIKKKKNKKQDNELSEATFIGIND